MNTKKYYWTPRAKLNAVLLLILIFLAGIAVRMMLTNKALYFPGKGMPTPAQFGGHAGKEDLLSSHAKTFTVDTMKFTYPDSLTLTQENNMKARLSHSTPYEHSNYCDFKGDAPKLKEIADFDAYFEVVPSGMKVALQAHESPFFMEHQWNGTTPIVSEGFVDPIRIGQDDNYRDGYMVTDSVEGCGEYHYYFPVSGGVLYISHPLPDAVFSVENAKTSTLQGAIKPKLQEDMFKAILDSVRDTTAGDTMTSEDAAYWDQFAIPNPSLHDLVGANGKPLDEELNDRFHEELQTMYPLYPHITWGTEVKRKYPFGQLNLTGILVESATISDTEYAKMSPAFEEYYDKKLKDLGWTRDDNLAAGGPGGEITVYRKGGDYLLLEYYSDEVHPNPNKIFSCPCNVKFSIFVGTNE